MHTTTAHQPAARQQFDLAGIHAKHERLLRYSLAAKGVPARDLDDVYQSLLLSTIEHPFDHARGASPLTFVNYTSVRRTATSYWRQTARKQAANEISFEALRPADDENCSRAVEEALAELADDSGDPEFHAQLSQFSTALTAALTAAQRRVFEHTGLAVLSLTVPARAELAAELELQPDTLRKLATGIQRTFRKLWPEHFDAKLPV